MHRDDKPVVLVTGASYGVGAATALMFAERGFDLAVTATRLENLRETMKAIEKRGSRAIVLALELRSHESVVRTAREAIDAFGHIDVLVNNAAANLRRHVVDITLEEWNDVIATNLTGTFFMCQQIAHYCIANGRPGCIVNIASAHGLVGASERSAYGISKAAVLHMTRTLAVEWAEHGIRVNAVAPGRLLTESPSRAETGGDPKYMAAMLERIPLHRLATVEEVAAAVCYLASPQAASITGQTVVLDGGLTAT